MMPFIYQSASAVMNLQRTGKTSWYRIENKAAAPAQVWIYDEIGMFGTSAGQFVAEMSDVHGPIEVHLSTPGGEVFDGIAIYNCLKNRTGVTVIVDSIAASIGSVIAMGADPGQLFMEPSAKMMIHDGFAMAAGNAAELGKMVEQLNSASDTIAGIYSARTGVPAADWRTRMKDETWFTADEAVAAGLADGIRSGAKNKLQNKAQEPSGEPAASLTEFLIATLHDAAQPHGAMTGSHSHPHPAYGGQGGDASHDHSHSHDGDATHKHSHAPADSLKAAKKKKYDPDNDGDDDSTAAGDTDHDYVKPDGSPGPKAKPSKKKPFPGAAPPFKKKSAKSMFPLLDTDVDNSPWDASKAWKAGAASDDPAKFYAGICAGRKAGDPDNQSSWALPYKYSPSSPPNAAAVKNALARLSQTQGLTNKAEAQATLEKVMKAINPDYEPDDEFDISLLTAAFAIGLEGATR